MRHAARLNNVDHLVHTALLTWGRRTDEADLRRAMGQWHAGGGEPGTSGNVGSSPPPHAPAPGLVVGADVLYDIDAIPDLVGTIARLEAPLTLLAYPPRHLGPTGESCQETDVLVESAARHGLRVDRRWQEGEAMGDCVLVVGLVRDE